MAQIVQAAHLCIDMQNIFARGGVWETPWMEKVLPAISEIAARYRERTVFTRFVTPEQPEDRSGRWQGYFTKWKAATRANLGPRDLDLVPTLSRYVPPALVVDKPAYSAFYGSRLADLLVEKHVGTVVITGAETDVCVLVYRAQRGRPRLSCRHRRGRALQFVRYRARCADDDVSNEISRTDRSRQRRGTVRDMASGIGAASAREPRPRLRR